MCSGCDRGRRRNELICECREVRSDRDNRHHGRRGHHREDDFRCGCGQFNRRRRSFWW